MMLGNDTEVRKSKLHGKGVFALRDFAAREVVLEWDTSNTLTDEQYERLPFDQRGYVTRYKREWLYMMEPERYVNHSCEPNSAALNGYDVAIRDIKVGEEITMDYASVLKEGDGMACRCGARSCKGTIIGTAV